MPFELLSPAGNWECARAAVENGANAIYFGLNSGFNARARATNFPVEELPDLMAFLHRRGVRGYVTLNTLVFTDELAALAEHVVEVATAGVDAVLVQDLGAARLIRATCPELEIHASTQMTLTSAEGMQLAEQLGLARTVLPREMSIAEMNVVKDDTTLGLEAFVHGALCVAYSGQCLTSESLGGRSANRGQCAQACRMPYEVICDGEDVPLDDVRYLLSPQDLAAYALIPELIQAGVRSFKIEGRLKSPEYVANATRHYRKALDEAIAGIQSTWTKQEVEELELSFSRGLSPGWLAGIDHKMLVPGLSSTKRGAFAGTIASVGSQHVRVMLECSLTAGDGVVFDGDRTTDSEQGGRVWKLRKNGKAVDGQVAGGLVEIEFGNQSVDFSTLYPGQRMWKTDDPRLTKRLRATFSGPDPIRKLPVDLVVKAAVNQPLAVTATTESGVTVEVQSGDSLPLARKHVVTAEILQEQFSRLGHTTYQLRDLHAEIEGGPMAPLSLLGSVRKQLIAALDQAIAVPAAVHVDRSALPRLLAGIQERSAAAQVASVSSDGAPRLHVLCRHLHQLESALQSGCETVICDFADIREYKQAVELAKSNAAALWLATPRIEKPGETGIFKLIAKQHADGVLVRNLGGLSFFRKLNVPCVADFSLNAANEITVDVLREFGVERITPSYDLNREQLLSLIAAADAAALEVVIHQHMPMFHMEHCVFCAVLSPGTDKTNCGRPCDDHVVQLRDRVGMEHPLHADVGCRNTLYNATPQSSAEIVKPLIAAGVNHFRVELLDDSAAQARTVIATYQQLLRGETMGRDVWRKLRATNRVGVTRGTLEDKRNPLAIL